MGSEQLAREAVARGSELIITSGGDGTVSMAANALIGTGIPLAVIPSGSANAFANGLGLPTTIEEACIAILQGATLTIDVARCNGRAMILLAGIGLEADTVHETDHQLKKDFGILSYILAGLAQMQDLPRFEAEIVTENQKITVSATAITVANIAPHTSILAQGAGNTVPDDGLLDVTIFTPSDTLEALGSAIELFQSGLLHQATESHHIGYLRATEVKVTTNPPQKLTIDGEMRGTTPTAFEIVPASLTVVTFYEQVFPERLTGLLDLNIQHKSELETLILNYYIPLMVPGKTLTKIITTIVETSIGWWETMRRVIMEVGEMLIMSIHQALATSARILDQTIQSVAQLEQVEPSQTETHSTYIEVVHKISGRIRWRIPRLRKDSAYVKQIQQLLESFQEVTAVIINPVASSVVVKYIEETMLGCRI